MSSSHLTLDENSARYQIRGFTPGFIQVNDQILNYSIILNPQTLLAWEPQDISELTAAHFEPIKILQPTIVLLGTGATRQFPAVALYGDLLNQGIGVEVMNTRAACHTYQALTAEGRNVVAALIIK